MNKTVLAIAAHPDDIEFVMSGTLMRLRNVGWSLHYFNIANGCCGSMDLPPEEIAAVRLAEAKAAADRLGAEFHAPICNDLEIFHVKPLMQRVLSVVRKVRPSIILTHALADYMEDHQNTARLAVSGAFSRGVPNFSSVPEEPAIQDDVALYHAQPHGNRDPLRHVVKPELAVDVADLIPAKSELLALHQSQSAWLDSTQGLGSYTQTMVNLNREVGQLSERFEYAEGWRRHLHIGLSSVEFDPLSDTLAEHCHQLV
ncbi:MAG TPA: LmbE family protein [Planctomycetaceae bacterium]|nr:LmbE family protein [Planctomycetaceae bacterium]